MKILGIIYKIIAKSFIAISLSLNLAGFALFWILFKIGDEKYQIENSKEYYVKNLQCVKLENVVDSISYAGQLGRLDTITLMLTIFGIVLGFVAIFGFMYIKEGSRIVAKEETEEWLSKKGQTTIYEYLKKNPDIIEKAINQRMDTELGKPKNLSNEESIELSDIKWEPEY
jgi:hypothetical protein